MSKMIRTYVVTLRKSEHEIFIPAHKTDFIMGHILRLTGNQVLEIRVVSISSEKIEAMTEFKGW